MVKCVSFVVGLVLLGTPALGHAGEPSSASMARELAALLDRHKLDSIAARMPGDDKQFVAALYYPNAQLLVVSTRYEAPSLLQEQIWNRKYRDVYTALHGGGERKGKFFVMDIGANGLPSQEARDGQIDVVYEDATTQTTFNGDWRSQKLSEAEYQKRLEAADERYATMLSILAAALKASESTR